VKTPDAASEGGIMGRFTVGMLVLVAATLALFGLVAAQQKDKDRAKPKDLQPAALNELTAKLVRVDVAKGSITVEDAGQERDFRVTEQTKIIGPRGAVNKARLKDERFAPGWELKLTIAADGKKMVQIQLPLRKEKKSDKE
jgi:hypothetical protein